EVQQQVFASQSQVLLTQTDREIDTEIRALRSLIAQQVDALVLVGSHRYGTESDAAISPLLEGYERTGGPVAGLGQRHDGGRTIGIEIGALRSLIALQVDALVLVGSHRYGTESDAAISALLEGFERNGGTVVGLGQALGVGRTIVPDNAAAAHELATALVVE